MRKLAVMVAALACASLVPAAPPSPFPPSAAAGTFAEEDSLLARFPARRLSEYLELRILMTPRQRRQYLMLSAEKERSRWIKRLWAELDPTPASERNERRAEHEQRIALARECFGARRSPGWDDRGETLIRWGIPSLRIRTMGNVTTNGVTPPGETWYYHRYAMTIGFEDLTLTGHYSFATGSMERPLSTLDEARKAARSRELSRSTDRKNLEPIEILDPEEWKNALNNANPGEIDYWRDAAIMEILANTSAMDDVMNGFEHMQVKAAASTGNFEKFLNELPVVHDCDIEQNSLLLHADVVRFKGAGRALRAEVSFEVPVNELGFSGTGRVRTADVEFEVLVKDYDFRDVCRGNDRIKPVLSGDTAAPAALLPGQVVLSLKPGYYRIGIEAFDRKSRKRASAVRTVHLADFAGAPALSDIQFASGIEESAAGERFVKNGLRVVPHPLRAYRKPFPASFYFEIYGLDADPGGRVFYRVEYRIVPLEKRRWGPVLVETPATISSSFETSGYGATQPQRLSIATDELWEGPFRLEIAVTDRRSFRTAAQSAEFSIVQ